MTASTDLITLSDIADLTEAIGQPETAELYRYLDSPVQPWQVTESEREDAERLDALWTFLDEVGQPTGRGKHDDKCWRKHPLCLAEAIRQVIS
jgi:hypothetical protein